LNIEEYISSGILEAYAAGALSATERAEVELHLSRYPQLQKELAAIEEIQEQLLMKTAVAPRAHVKEKLFASLESQKQYAKTVRIQPDQPSLSFWKYAVAASISITLIASYVAYDYRSKWLNTVVSLNDLIAQNQQIAQDYNVVNNRINRIESDLKVLNDPAFTRVIMAGTANATQATAYVYWNEKSKEVYLSLQNMRSLSQEHQYQLWAIIDGKPVDAGVFDGNVAGLLKMKDIGEGAAAFAVTVEPRGGNPLPSLETLQVMGNVVKV
jgi:anti-sigma-K factor RskA